MKLQHLLIRFNDPVMAECVLRERAIDKPVDKSLIHVGFCKNITMENQRLVWKGKGKKVSYLQVLSS